MVNIIRSSKDAERERETSNTIHNPNLQTLLHNLFNNHNFALPPSLSVTAALLKAGLPVSLTLVAIRQLSS